ncbi:eukaryotic aspartyl protease [Apiospora rasikravindrae]|uniref:Eukaryotic aspartyl protease n=1 Tax=Apiospora rasikravindrae TaxID=990691 RepID=A0ABR1U182_9PEZI
MQSIMKVLFLLGLVALACASPVSSIKKRGVYKVERIANPDYTGRNGPRALLKTLRKYRMPVPASLMDTVNAQSIDMISKRRVPAEYLNGADHVSAEMVSKRQPKKGKKAKAKGNGGAAAGAAAGAGVGAAAGAGAAAGNATGGLTGGKAAANATGVGLVAAKPEENDVEYLSPVKIGGQTVNLDFDSGSSDLWVFNSQLSAAATQGHQIYDPTKSKTFKMMQGASFQISYGDGSGAAGNVGTDTVDLGGAMVQNQAIEMATAVSKSFVQDTNNNGLLGLAFSKLNTVKPQQQKTFFDNVMPSLAEPVFTADLRAQAAGAYEFGRIDNTKFTGDMTWVKVDSSQGFWQFTSEKFAVDGGAPQAGTAGSQAIADTGTTLILADPKAVQAYYSKVQGAQNDEQAGGVTFPCDAKLPDLQLDVGGTMATVAGKFINFAQVDQTTCFGGVQASPANMFIYGDIFFKSNFVAFNGGNQSLGFAQHV